MHLPRLMSGVQPLARVGPEEMHRARADPGARPVGVCRAAILNESRIRPLISRTYPLRGVTRTLGDFLIKSLPGTLVLIQPEISS